MSKLIVSPSSKKELELLLNMNVSGFIFHIDKLSVNSNFYINILDLNQYLYNNKEIFVSLNKIMHNSDLPYLYEVMTILKDLDVKILFYDMAVYNYAKKLGIVDKLVIFQDHLNASYQSNRFYNRQGINYSYLTSDITLSELLDIKRKSNMKIMFKVYGYLPIFYSRRYLISNYSEYINDTMGDNYQIISDSGNSYPIKEEEYGTTIYSSSLVNLINYLDNLEDIDYLVMDSNNIDSKEFISVLNKFLNHEKMDECYVGFLDTKTIYKVK